MPPAPPPPPPPPQRTARTRVAPIPPEEAPRRRRRALPVILWLIALLVIGGVAAAYLLRGSDQVTVPSLQGLQLAQAQAKLDQAGLVGDPVPVQAEAEDGTVVSTSPPAGTRWTRDRPWCCA
jgi:serine/threonine-protein kinase